MKCFHCQKDIEGPSFKVVANIPLPPNTVVIDGEVKNTVLQQEVNLCIECLGFLRGKFHGVSVSHRRGEGDWKG